MKIRVDYKSFFKKGIKQVDDDFFIRLINGYQGSGKTYLAIKLVHEYEPKDRKIKTNIKSYKDKTKQIIYFDRIDDIINDSDDSITYIIDEVSKRYTKNSSQDLRFYSWLQQSRKHKRHVYLITQEYIQVPPWLRGIASEVYTTTKCRFLPLYKTSLGTPFLDDNFEWSIDEFLVLYYKRTKDIANLYDTFESINTL